MAGARKSRTPREKYGEELRIRRLAAGLTQEALSEGVVCSPTLISHFEAGRRLPNPEDAQRLDQVLTTDGFFARWLRDLDGGYANYFAAVAELEREATEIWQFGHSLLPGLLQTEAYARAVFRAYSPNHQADELDQKVVIRMRRAQLLDRSSPPVVWTLLDEAVLRRRIGGPQVMAEQLGKVASMGEAGRLRLHVLPFGVGEHALLEGMLYLMSFEDAPPVAYAEGVNTGHLMDDPALVRECQGFYALALGDALSHKQSVDLIKAVAEECEREQQ
jgi:transcriptional regulator with XRE-family HTH domain